MHVGRGNRGYYGTSDVVGTISGSKIREAVLFELMHFLLHKAQLRGI